MNRQMTRALLVCARVLSNLFRPVYYPVVCFVLLFTMTYLNMLSFYIKAWVLVMVATFTILFPYLGNRIYLYSQGWKWHHLRHQHKRSVPFILSIISYVALLVVMNRMHLPSFMMVVIVVSLMIQCLCLVINIWYKVSVHSAGAGAIIGGLVMYALKFEFNPLWWLCGTILISGMVNSSRMLLRQHTLWQVLLSTWMGVVCALLGLLII